MGGGGGGGGGATAFTQSEVECTFRGLEAYQSVFVLSLQQFLVSTMTLSASTKHDHITGGGETSKGLKRLDWVLFTAVFVWNQSPTID